MSGKSRKAIEKIIMFKMMGWLKSIDDEELRNLVKRDLIVSGGCIASMLLGEDVNDYDVYLRDADTAKKLAKFYMDKLGKIDNARVATVDIDIEPTGGWLPHAKVVATEEFDADDEYWAIRTFKESDEAANVLKNCSTKQLKISIKSAGLAGEDTDMSQYRYFESLPFTEVLKYFEKGFKTQSQKPYQLLFMSSNAISLSSGIQIITRFIGEPQAIHKCFDFVHVKNYFTFSGGLVLDPDAMECLLTKQLVYNNSMYPVSSVFRMRKFIRRGWSITAGEMFKIMYDVSKLNLNSPAVLMEQLTGADVAYFRQVLGMLADAKPGDIDRTYLFAVIDRVFKTNDIEDKDFTAEEIGEISDEIQNEMVSLGLDDVG